MRRLIGLCGRGILAALTVASLGLAALGAPRAATLAAGTLPAGGTRPAPPFIGRRVAAPEQQTLRFYNAPVGYPGYNGTVGFWDTRLQPVAATAVGPARVPYQAQFATVSVTRTITQTLPVASIFSQAYVRLGLSLAAIDGAAPAAVPGRVALSGVGVQAARAVVGCEGQASAGLDASPGHGSAGN